jgi:hypothetical protein
MDGRDRNLRLINVWAISPPINLDTGGILSFALEVFVK